MGKCCCCPTRPRVTSTTWRIQVHDLTDGSVVWFDEPGSMDDALFRDVNLHVLSDTADAIISFTLSVRDTISGQQITERKELSSGSQDNKIVKTTDGLRYSYETTGGDHKVDSIDDNGVVQWTYNTGTDGEFTLLSFGNTCMLDTTSGWDQIDSSGSLVRTWVNCTPRLMLADNKVVHAPNDNTQQAFTDDSLTWTLDVSGTLPGTDKEYTLVSGGYRINNITNQSGYILDDGTLDWSFSFPGTILGVSGTSKTFVQFGNHIIRYDENVIDWWALDVFSGDVRNLFYALEDGGFLILCEAGLIRYDTNGSQTWINTWPHWDYVDIARISDVDTVNGYFVIIGALQTVASL